VFFARAVDHVVSHVEFLQCILGLQVNSCAPHGSNA